MMHLNFIFWLFFSVAGTVGFAQNGSIHLTVCDHQQRPLANGTVALRLRKDSSIVIIQRTDTAGYAGFDNLPAGDYFLQITVSGFSPYFSSHFFIPGGFELRLPPVSLHPSSYSTATETVPALKLMKRIKPGKTTVHFDDGINGIRGNAWKSWKKIGALPLTKVELLG